MTRAAEIAVEQLQAAVGTERIADRPQYVFDRRSVAGAARHASPSGDSQGSSRVRQRARGRRPSIVSACNRPTDEQLANQEAHAAGCVKVIHVGGAVRIDAREQRHDRPTSR